MFVNIGVTMLQNTVHRICKDCVHFQKNDRFWRFNKNATVFGHCKKFGKTDLVSGDVELTFASLCRDDDSKCGLEGIHYESKIRKQ